MRRCQGGLTLALALGFVLASTGCSDDAVTTGDSGLGDDGQVLADGPRAEGLAADATSGDATSGDATSGDGALADGPIADASIPDSGPPPACDYELFNKIIVIEAENLPLAGSWSKQTANAGFTGSGYIGWTGAPSLGTPGKGTLTAKLKLAAGRYRMQWRNRIGKGTNATEHNDSFVRYPDVDHFYGLKMVNGKESRAYPKPVCEDAAKMAAVLALPQVGVTKCPNGTSKDGWTKVYSSGATDWKWSTNTSDSDAHQIYLEVNKAGVYTLEISARSDFHLIDRIVIHDESVAAKDAQVLTLKPTPCS